MTHGTMYAYRKGCRCDDCRGRSRENKRRWREGNGPGIVTGQQSHGQHAYSKHGCRCEVCTAAQAKAMREYYERKRRHEGILKRRWATSE